MTSRPTRLPTNHLEFEELCADWMRWYGFWDATKTRRGADGGVDVRAWNAVAQAKFQKARVGEPPLRDLAGVRAIQGVPYALFFAHAPGFSEPAMTFAERSKIELFIFDRYSKSFRGLTPLARKLCAGERIF